MNKKFVIGIIFVSILAFIPLIDLFHQGLPVTHDGRDHIARIANFYQNLTEGAIAPRWASNLNWGYGHPILMFLYPLPSYISSVFHFLGFSLINSLKLVFGISYVTSALVMFLWLQCFLKKEDAVLGSLLYIYAPYRFVDLYVRGAIGEHVAFIFPPLICYFLYKLCQKSDSKFVVFGSLSLAGLILSHNAITIMFLPLLLFYMFFLVSKGENKLVLTYQYTCILVIGFGLSAFFWIPAFFEGKYTLRDIVTKGEYASRFVRFQDFIYGKWNYGGSGQFTVQLGIVQGIFTVLSIVLLFFKRTTKERKKLIAGLLAALLISLFLMTSSSSFVWQYITVLQKFQFPWRLLSISVFASSVLGALVFSAIPQKYKSFILIVLVALLFFVSQSYWHVQSYLLNDEHLFTSVYNGTTDTGESAPIWSVRFMEHRPKARMEVVMGKATIKEKFRSSTKHEYSINAKTPTRILENTLYFPGWRVIVDGKMVPVQFQDPSYRGLMTFDLQKGMHKVLVEFGETKLRMVANVITILSLFGLGIYTILNKKLWQIYR